MAEFTDADVIVKRLKDLAAQYAVQKSPQLPADECATIMRNAARMLESQVAEIARHEATLAAFDDGTDISPEVFLLLEEKDELRKWIARSAWHCKKVNEQRAELDRLQARLAEAERRERAAVADAKLAGCITCRKAKRCANNGPGMACFMWEQRGPQEADHAE